MCNKHGFIDLIDLIGPRQRQCQALTFNRVVQLHHLDLSVNNGHHIILLACIRFLYKGTDNGV